MAMTKVWACLLVGALALMVGCKSMECCKKAEKGCCKKAEKAEAAPAVKMEMVAVESSLLDEIGYDAEKQVLKVKLDNGETYKYMNVPQATFEKLMKAKSKGEFFTKKIKDKFETKKCD
jgi:hypothetical protein